MCSHEESRCPRARSTDHTVECWLHGSRFDLRTGKPTGLPATEPVPVYPVRIDGDDVYVGLPSRELSRTSRSRPMSTLEIRDLHVS